MNIKRRNMWMQVLLTIVTLGLYTFYWFYVTMVELKELSRDEKVNPTILFLLIFVPFGILYSHYKYFEMYEKVSKDHLNKWVIYLLWLFVTPAVWFIVQMELNRQADLQLASPPVLPSPQA